MDCFTFDAVLFPTLHIIYLNWNMRGRICYYLQFSNVSNFPKLIDFDKAIEGEGMFIGAIMGDTVGYRFEFHNHVSKSFELSPDDQFVMYDSMADLCSNSHHGNF